MSETGVGSVAYAALCAELDEDIRETVEDTLRHKQAWAEETGDKRTARVLGRVLRRRRLFDRVVAKVCCETVPAFLDAQSAGTVGANGEFMKWLLDWLSKPENWQGLLQFIMALINLFGALAGGLLPWLVGLALVASSAAAPSQIIASESYPVYTQIVLDVQPVEGTTWRSVVWQFAPDRVSGMQLPDGRMVFTAPPGRYDVLASVVAGVTGEGESVTITPAGHQVHRAAFVIEGQPQPEPDDEDQPPGPPPVVIDGAIVLIVEESADRTPETAKLLADATFWASVTARGMRWRVYDVDSPAAAAIAPRVKDILPALIVTDSAGKVLYVDHLPATAAAVDAAIKGATGR